MPNMGGSIRVIIDNTHVYHSKRPVDGPRAIIFGDSFSALWRINMAESFSETLSINGWLAKDANAGYFPINLINNFKPDIVIYEIAERRLGKQCTLENCGSYYFGKKILNLFMKNLFCCKSYG